MKYKVGDEVVICGPSVSGRTRSGVVRVKKYLGDAVYWLSYLDGTNAGAYPEDSLKSAKEHYIQQFKKAYDSL